MSIVWKKYTTAGAVASILIGSVSATVFIILSPTVWVDVFNFKEAIFPLKNPAIISMPLSFICGIIASYIWPDKEAEQKYEDEKLRMYLGVGAE
jgi:cation/acetate symporter